MKLPRHYSIIDISFVIMSYMREVKADIRVGETLCRNINRLKHSNLSLVVILSLNRCSFLSLMTCKQRTNTNETQFEVHENRDQMDTVIYWLLNSVTVEF
jgi:hypothetical protein